MIYAVILAITDVVKVWCFHFSLLSIIISPIKRARLVWIGLYLKNEHAP